MAAAESSSKAKDRWFRIFSADRKIRRAVGANSLQELVTEAKKKMNLNAEEVVSIVLEDDGTLVDEEDYFQFGVQLKDRLMLLRANEEWSVSDDLHPVERDEVDGDTDDCGDVADGENPMLRQLAARLRRDLKEILLFDVSECQVIIDADKFHLAQLMCRSAHDVEKIQAACQRSVDEHTEYKEACSLLDLVKRQSSDLSEKPVDRKRKKI